MKGIADTGFLVAFANANDKHHKWAAQLSTGVTEPLLTCEAVIAETAFHLESAAVALAMINEGLVADERVISEAPCDFDRSYCLPSLSAKQARGDPPYMPAVR